MPHRLSSRKEPPAPTHQPSRATFCIRRTQDAIYEQRCALFYYTVRAPRGWDRILLIFSKDFGSSTMRFFLFE